MYCSDIELKFWEFHHNNPHILQLFLRYAREAKRAGRSHYGAKAIFERIRWHVMVETESDDDFKLCNNHTAYYARLAMQTDPSLRGFFRTKIFNAERWETSLCQAHL